MSSPGHDLPEGTVTVLFTDLVGSTLLNQQLGDVAAGAPRESDRAQGARRGGATPRCRPQGHWRRADGGVPVRPPRRELRTGHPARSGEDPGSASEGPRADADRPAHRRGGRGRRQSQGRDGNHREAGSKDWRHRVASSLPRPSTACSGRAGSCWRIAASSSSRGSPIGGVCSRSRGSRKRRAPVCWPRARGRPTSAAPASAPTCSSSQREPKPARARSSSWQGRPESENPGSPWRPRRSRIASDCWCSPVTAETWRARSPS